MGAWLLLENVSLGTTVDVLQYCMKFRPSPRNCMDFGPLSSYFIGKVGSVGTV